MTATLEIWMPAPPEIFGAFLAAVVAYLAYVIAKFIISIWTGA